MWRAWDATARYVAGGVRLARSAMILPTVLVLLVLVVAWVTGAFDDRGSTSGAVSSVPVVSATSVPVTTAPVVPATVDVPTTTVAAPTGSPLALPGAGDGGPVQVAGNVWSAGRDLHIDGQAWTACHAGDVTVVDAYGRRVEAVVTAVWEAGEVQPGRRARTIALPVLGDLTPVEDGMVPPYGALPTVLHDGDGAVWQVDVAQCRLAPYSQDDETADVTVSVTAGEGVSWTVGSLAGVGSTVAPVEMLAVEGAVIPFTAGPNRMSCNMGLDPIPAVDDTGLVCVVDGDMRGWSHRAAPAPVPLPDAPLVCVEVQGECMMLPVPAYGPQGERAGQVEVCASTGEGELVCKGVELVAPPMPFAPGATVPAVSSTVPAEVTSTVPMPSLPPEVAEAVEVLTEAAAADQPPSEGDGGPGVVGVLVRVFAALLVVGGAVAVVAGRGRRPAG